MSDQETDRPCTCIYDLLAGAKAKRQSIPGLMIVMLVDGTQVAGNVIMFHPTIVGNKVRNGIAVYKYCPFCGKKLPESLLLPGSPGKESPN